MKTLIFIMIALLGGVGVVANNTQPQVSLAFTETSLSEETVLPLALPISYTLKNEATTAISKLSAINALDPSNIESIVQPVNLGAANDFVILAKTGISTCVDTLITGNIGVSPAAATYITGFSLILDSTGTFSTSSNVVGNVYAADYTSPTPSNLTTAVLDMQAAYVDAAGRAADYTELYTGDLSEKTLTSGVYKFGTGVVINKDLTLNGSSTDIFIFQIAGTLTQASDTKVILTGGLLPENVIWVVADTVAIGTGAVFQGTVLAMTNISLNTNATVIGKLYAQTAVTIAVGVVVKS